MATFEKDVLRVGTVRKNGRRYDFDSDRLQRYARSVNELASEGLKIPLVMEHSDPNDTSGKEGPREKAAKGVKNGAGWITGARIDGGVLKLKMDVTDKDVAKKLQDKSIKFVSPDLRSKWTSPVSGKVYEDVIYNAALTHHPVGAEQGEFVQFSEGVLQLSLADYTQLAEDEDETESEGSSETPDTEAPPDPADNTDNPDMPEESGPSESEQKLKLCLAWLEKLDIPMQSDTTTENFVDRLTTSLMAVSATLDKMEAEEATDESEEEDSADMPVKEEQPDSMMQFSEHPAFKRLLDTHRGQDRKRIATLVKQGRIGKKLAATLASRADSVQLSDDFQSERPALALSEVLDLLEDSTVDLTKDETAQLSEHNHPRGENWYSGTDPDTGRRQGESEEEEAKRIFAEEKARMKRYGYANA